MTKWNIWREGYCCTGDIDQARLISVVEAETFHNACDKYYKNDDQYDTNRLTYWGCRLFYNEEDARVFEQGFTDLGKREAGIL